MPDIETGKDSPIWIVTRMVHHNIRLQYSEMEFEIVLRDPLAAGAKVTFTAEPPDAIVKLPQNEVVPTLTGHMVSIETTPYYDSLPVKLTATATYQDDQGNTRTGIQIRFLNFRR